MFKAPSSTIEITHKCKPTKKNGGKTSYTESYPNQIFHVLEKDYDREYDCEAYGCDGICRCGTISNAHVTRDFVNKVEFFNAIWESSGDNLEDALAFIYAKNNFEPYDFEVEVDGGYYGQEVGYITFSSLSIDMDTFNKCSNNTERLQLVLKDEHKFLTEATEKVVEWEFVEVPKDKIELTNKKTKSSYINDCKSYFDRLYWDKVPEEEVLRLSKLCAPIVLKDGNKYKAIDGNHRFQAANQAKPSIAFRNPSKQGKRKYLDFGANSDMIYVIRPKE